MDEDLDINKIQYHSHKRTITQYSEYKPNNL